MTPATNREADTSRAPKTGQIDSLATVTARNRDIVDGRIDLRMGRQSEQWEAFSDLRLRDMGEKGG